MEQRDIDDLKRFASRVYAWLAECYGQPFNAFHGWPVVSLRTEFEQIGRDAWRDFASDFPLAETLSRIDKVSDADLRAHGLYGAQLRYKLQLIDFAAERTVKQLSVKRVRGTGWWKTLIELIDNLLDSLAGATGIPGALKELKDALAGHLRE